MRGLQRFVAAVVALAAVAAAAFAADGPGSGTSPNAAMTPAQVALAFEWAIDVERSAHGLPHLQVDFVESVSALNWSSLMAMTGTLAEDPSTRASIAAYDPAWQAFGENVGVGPTPEAIEAALMASPPHRANILGNFTHMGVGAVIANGTVWLTERCFR
jgi:uncharacterized protein YkwD